MRQVFFAFAFCVTACATPHASADTPEINYGELVTACVAAAGGDEAALNACQGVGSQPCMNSDGGASTMGMVMCLSAEGEAWTSLMDAAQARLAAANPDTAGALTRAQQQWREYRDAECSYSVVRWGEGSGAQVQYAGCMSNLAADRAIALIVIEKLDD